MKQVLQSFGLPTSLGGLIIALAVLAGFLVLSWLFGWLIAVIILAVGFGLYNGFFTRRKPRI